LIFRTMLRYLIDYFCLEFVKECFLATLKWPLKKSTVIDRIYKDLNMKS